MNIVGHAAFEQTGNTVLEVREALRAIDRWYDIEQKDFLRALAPTLAVAAELTARDSLCGLLGVSAYRDAIEATGGVAVVPELEHDVRVSVECGPAA
ncbi:hypothetical protein [Nocardia brasiliensis]|uniref:hypothetical protein n=1 Tax=Nocardia brasiliensis TaxID=37326 RepID=UPI00366A6647